MALSIKDPEADRLVRELAAITGESITEAARKSFDERLRRVRSRSGPEDVVRAPVREIIERARARTSVDPRSEDEILGYDSTGTPAT